MVKTGLSARRPTGRRPATRELGPQAVLPDVLLPDRSVLDVAAELAGAHESGDAHGATRDHCDGGHELTAREREVLRLMAEGLADRGIAERLWVAPKTVETHVRHILRKLQLPPGAAYNRRVQAVVAQLRV